DKATREETEKIGDRDRDIGTKTMKPAPTHARRRSRDTTRHPTSTTPNKNLAARTAAAWLAAMAVCCAPRLGEAFLPPPPPPPAAFTATTATGGRYNCRVTSSRPASVSTGVWHPRVGGPGSGAATATMMMAAAKGFGKSPEPSPATSAGDKGAKEA
ncbi:unnamed protein product, partial [Laminaria digitata]